MNSSRLFFVVVSALIGTFGLLSCGGNSDSNDRSALCRQNCEKSFDLCVGDGGAIGATSKATCLMGCSAPSNNANTCSNSAAILAGVRACLNQTTCAGYTACLATIPECVSSVDAGSSGTGGGTAGRSGSGGSGGRSGTGGTSGARTGGASGTAGASGTGGMSGAGGAGGSAAGRGCQDLLTCCNATTNPLFQSACMANYSTAMAMGDAVCASAYAMVRATLCPGL